MLSLTQEHSWSNTQYHTVNINDPLKHKHMTYGDMIQSDWAFEIKLIFIITNSSI